MNKRTRAIDEETYKLIISTIQKGFEYQGVMHKPNERIATVLQLEYNLGLRIGDILNLTMDNFMKDGSRYRLDIHEQKTGKYRNFTVPVEIYNFIRDYAYENNISPKAKLFPITERAVSKHLKVTCDYLGLEGIGTHSFRKAYATNIYVNNHYNIELVKFFFSIRQPLLHSVISVSALRNWKLPLRRISISVSQSKKEDINFIIGTLYGKFTNCVPIFHVLF